MSKGKKLEHRNYFKIAEGNIEHIRGDIWDVNITKWPLAVYNPGLELLKIRLNTFSPGVNTDVVNLEKDLNGHHLSQNVGRGATSGSSTWSFIDKEDQAITYLVNDWLDQIADADTGFGRHKSQLIIQYNLIFYNTLLSPIRQYDFYTATYGGSSLTEDTQQKGGDLSEISLTTNFEHSKRHIF